MQSLRNGLCILLALVLTLLPVGGALEATTMEDCDRATDALQVHLEENNGRDARAAAERLLETLRVCGIIDSQTGGLQLRPAHATAAEENTCVGIGASAAVDSFTIRVDSTTQSFIDTGDAEYSTIGGTHGDGHYNAPNGIAGVSAGAIIGFVFLLEVPIPANTGHSASVECTGGDPLGLPCGGSGTATFSAFARIYYSVTSEAVSTCEVLNDMCLIGSSHCTERRG